MIMNLFYFHVSKSAPVHILWCFDHQFQQINSPHDSIFICWLIESQRSVFSFSNELIINSDYMSSSTQMHHETGHCCCCCCCYFWRREATSTFQTSLSLVFVRVTVYKAAAGAERWWESGTVTWWWLIETQDEEEEETEGRTKSSASLYLAPISLMTLTKGTQIKKNSAN